MIKVATYEAVIENGQIRSLTMPAYNGARFALPAPVARFVLHHPAGNSLVGDISMLIDSGPRARSVKPGDSGVRKNTTPRLRAVHSHGRLSHRR